MGKQRGTRTLFLYVKSRRKNPDAETLSAEALAFFDGCEVDVSPRVVRVERVTSSDDRGRGVRGPTTGDSSMSIWMVSMGITLPTPGTKKRERFDTWYETALQSPMCTPTRR